MFFKYINHLSTNLFIFKIYNASLIIYVACIFIDYIRFLLFKILKIRKFSLIIEKIIPELIGKLITLFNL